MDTRQYTVIHRRDGKVWTVHPRPATEVLMALIVQIENQSYKVIDSFSDGDDVFLDLCSRVRRDSMEDWRVLSIVDPYSDTMLNRIQQMQLRDELERIRRRPDLLAGAGPAVERMSAALERVLDGDGSYLTFIGE